MSRSVEGKPGSKILTAPQRAHGVNITCPPVSHRQLPPSPQPTEDTAALLRCWSDPDQRFISELEGASTSQQLLNQSRSLMFTGRKKKNLSSHDAETICWCFSSPCWLQWLIVTVWITRHTVTSCPVTQRQSDRGKTDSSFYSLY